MLPTYIRGPGDAAGIGAISSLRLVSVDVSQEASRRKYMIVLGDGAFYTVRITVETPDADDISLRDIFLRAAGLEVDDEARRHLRTGPRIKGVYRKGVFV